jgi:hypothetical protein
MDKNMLAEATSSDDTPTPGYMLNEIARKYIDEFLILQFNIIIFRKIFCRIHIVQLSNKYTTSRIFAFENYKK